MKMSDKFSPNPLIIYLSLIVLTVVVVFGASAVFKTPTIVNATPEARTLKIYPGDIIRYNFAFGTDVIILYDGDSFQVSYMLISNSVLSHAEQIAARTGSNICIDGIVYVVTEDLLYQYLVLKEIPR